MALYLTEDEISRLLTMEECVTAVEEGLRQWADGKASNPPRSRARVSGGILHVLPAASEVWGRMAVKAYATTRGGSRFVVLLFDLKTPDLLAILEADRLGQIRTGAASGVATKYMALPAAATLGIIGTGWQARSQATAVAAVRSLRSIRAWGRDRDRLLSFCRETEAACGVPVTPADSAEGAVRGADIVTTATKSPVPVLHGIWLAPGVHINAVGSNNLARRELDGDAVRRSSRIVVDCREQARLEAGDLMSDETDRNTNDRPGEGSGEPEALRRAIPLAAVVSGRSPGRGSEEEITLFKSLGLGIEDLAAATRVYDLALAAGVGRPVPGDR